MKRKKKAILYFLLLVGMLFIGIECNKPDDPPVEPTVAPPVNPDPKPEEEGKSDLKIETVIPSDLDEVYIKNFNRYTKVVTPNGGAIHIVAQSLITDEQIVRCRSILEHYLADYPGSMYGANKSAVANKMADNNSILCLLNGTDGENPIGGEVSGQPLYENEIQVEGGSWYMDQDYDHRDATFEEILHFVHDNGIGVDGEGGLPGALPAFQAEIRAAQVNAVDKNIWAGDPKWMIELANENSLSQEYLAALIDAYYGLWGAWTEDNARSMWGFYMPKVRSEIAAEDPMGKEIVTNKFFHPYLTYNARIDPSFDGVFSLKFDPAKSYTNASQYLKNITLLGKKDNSVIVNELDNNITGNEGTNTVIFSGNKSEYTIETNGDVTTVTDNVSNRDGSNILNQIFYVQFTDQKFKIK